VFTGAGRALTAGVVEITSWLTILSETFHMSTHYSFRCTALILLTAGYGWAGGHFIPAGSSPWAYVFQFVILLLLLVFGVGFLTSAMGAAALSADAPGAAAAGAAGEGTTGSAGSAPKRLRWNVRALSIFAGLTLIINIANIVQGAMGQHAYGSHNSFEDLVPIGMILAGDAIWLLTALPGGLLLRTGETRGTRA
jgi:hypothetical protein